jgi:hypothetical protein
MRIADHVFAWTIFAAAVGLIAWIGFRHPYGVFLDTPLFWMMVAMLNFLRLRNGYGKMQGLRTFCIVANLSLFTLTALAFSLFALRTSAQMGWQWVWLTIYDHQLWWAPYEVVATAALAELLFSLLETKGSSQRLPT